MRKLLETRKEVECWLRQQGIPLSYCLGSTGKEVVCVTIHDDLTIDVDRSVEIKNIDTPYLPVNFGTVAGDFGISKVKLASLEGCPKTVGGWFSCTNTEIESLEGGPLFVGGSYLVFENRLTSIEGAPELVNGDFNCSLNRLQSLDGSPRIVDGAFVCRGNGLKNLHGAPDRVSGTFSCQVNDLVNLKGLPTRIGGNFYSDLSDGRLYECLKRLHDAGRQFDALNFADIKARILSEEMRSKIDAEAEMPALSRRRSARS